MIQSLKNIKPKQTNHQIGEKYCFDISMGSSSVTQIAVGVLVSGEEVELHKHPTMVEYFFILEGEGEIQIESEIYKVSKNDFILIPNDKIHGLKNIGTDDFVFYYYGVKIDC